MDRSVIGSIPIFQLNALLRQLWKGRESAVRIRSGSNPATTRDCLRQNRYIEARLRQARLQQLDRRMTRFPPYLNVDPVSSRAQGKPPPQASDDTASSSRAPGAVIPAVGPWRRLHLIETVLQAQCRHENFC